MSMSIQDPNINWKGGNVNIPPVVHDSLILYIEEGVVPRGFLAAVLSNDLSKSVDKADIENLQALPHIVAWLYNTAPHVCYGSPGVVRLWAKHDGLKGLNSQGITLADSAELPKARKEISSCG